MAIGTGLPVVIRKVSHTPLTLEAGTFSLLNCPYLLKRIAASQSWSMTQASISTTGYGEQPCGARMHASTIEHVMNGRDTDAMIAFHANNRICRIGSALCKGKKLYYATDINCICVLDGPLRFDWASGGPLCAAKLSSKIAVARNALKPFDVHLKASP